MLAQTKANHLANVIDHKTGHKKHWQSKTDESCRLRASRIILRNRLLSSHMDLENIF